MRALARSAGGVCSYGDLAHGVRHRHVDVKLTRAFGRHLHGELGDDAAD